MHSELNIAFDFNESQLPQNVIICLSKIQSIGTLIEENLSGARFQDNKNFTNFVNIINKLFEKINQADYDITASSVFQRISQKLDTLELKVKDILLSETTDWTVINHVLDQLLEEFPLILTTQSDNLSIEKTNSLIGEISSIALDVRKSKDIAQSALEDINNYKIKTQTLAQLLAGRALNDSYEIRAKEEKRAAFWWTLATWIFAISTVCALIYVFLKQLDAAVNNEINYALLSTKILVTASLGLIAKWASKRANRHLAEESKYHRLSVNMASIDTFIAPLSEEEKYKVISAVAIKIFTEGTNNEVSTEFETASILDIVKGLIPKAEK